jgi:hypothetical protein
MTYRYRKRRSGRRYAWLFWIFAFLCVFYSLVLLIPHPGGRGSIVRHVASTRPACALSGAALPLAERDQIRLAACWFGMGKAEGAFMADNFIHAGFADPRFGFRTLRTIAVSPQGEVRAVGETLLVPGKWYRHAFIGRRAEHLFVEIMARADGTRCYGYGPYRSWHRE